MASTPPPTTLLRRSSMGRETLRAVTPLLVVLGLFAAALYGAFVALGNDADALAEREYQQQQRLIAAQAAERLADLMDRVEAHLRSLEPPEDPTASTEWLTAPMGIEAIVAAVSDEGVTVVDPDQRLEFARWAQEQPGLRAFAPARGQPNWTVYAGVDGRALHEALFSSLGQTHDAYIWVIDGERRIVSAPDANQVGSQPFEDIDPDTDFGRVLSAMVNGETGTGHYRWHDEQGDRTRLVAYMAVPGRDLRVAYSADRASVLALTHELHTRQRMWMLALIGALVVFSLVFTLRMIRRYRRRLQEAEQLGPYTLGTPLGAGGMGVVYEAHHALLRRPTAVKLLHQELSTPRNLARFAHEVQMTARLTHANTVTVFDYGKTDDGVFYYAMELIDGPTLRDVVEHNGAMDPSRVVHLLEQACGALSEAHANGLIHRDIKPENLMVCERGGIFDVAKVLDFGLVREIEKNDGAAIAGTPLYMAPEIFLDADSVDERSDVYALGAVAYYMVTGTDVFDGSTVTELAAQHALDEPISPRARLGEAGKGIPAELEDLILDCLAKEPTERPRDAAELAQRLDGLSLSWTQEQAKKAWGARPTRKSLEEAATMMAQTELGLARTRPLV